MKPLYTCPGCQNILQVYYTNSHAEYTRCSNSKCRLYFVQAIEIVGKQISYFSFLLHEYLLTYNKLSDINNVECLITMNENNIYINIPCENIDLSDLDKLYHKIKLYAVFS